MELGKRHDTTDTTDFCPRQPVTESCCGHVVCVANLLRTGVITGVVDFGLVAKQNPGATDSVSMRLCRLRLLCNQLLPYQLTIVHFCSTSSLRGAFVCVCRTKSRDRFKDRSPVS